MPIAFPKLKKKTLDCLNGAEWFSSLDLKLCYQQVEIEEDCKAS